MKVCNKCKVGKPTTEFYRNQAQRDGFNGQCKSCCWLYRQDSVVKGRMSVRSKKYRASHREQIRQHNKEWYEANRERRQLKNREWRQNNRSALAASKHAYYLANREVISEKKRGAFRSKTMLTKHLSYYAKVYTSLSSYRRKKWARSLVGRAVRIGLLVKPKTCSNCSKPVSKHVLDGHHDDYANPLVVRWLCRACHSAEHH